MLVLFDKVQTSVGAGIMHHTHVVDVPTLVTSSDVSLTSIEAIRMESEQAILHHRQVFHVGDL